MQEKATKPVGDVYMSDSSDDLDDAAAWVSQTGQDIDPVIEKRVRRKIDLFFMPTFIIGYGLVYYDKAILGSASLFGMTTDLHLSVVVNAHTKPVTVSTQRLSWATSIFYFGMLAGLYPMILLVQRFRVGRVLPILVMLWGLIAMCTAAVTTYQGLYVQRFFLGFVESVIPTTFMTVITSYYTQQEQAFRQSWWFSSTGVFTIVGGAISYGFANVPNGTALKRWQYIYLAMGALTVLFGIFCFAIPDSPMDAWFLSQEEKVVAVERLRKGQAGVRNHKIKMQHVKDALKDPKFLLIFIMMATAYTVNGAVSGFGPLIVSTFGWTTTDSILWQFPLGGVVLIFILLTGYISSRRTGLIIPQLLLCTIPVIVGCALIWRSTWSHRAALPIIGYTLIGFFGPVVSLIIVAGMSNVAGATKKSLMAATIFVAYAVGNIVGPNLIKSQTKARHYPELWLGLIICYAILIVASCCWWGWLRKCNARRGRAVRDGSGMGEGAWTEGKGKEGDAFRDLTDDENLHFRYVL